MDFMQRLLILTILCFFAGRGKAEKAKALFVFGDSFADTGNRNAYNQTENQPWKRPYGLTWPGYPAGRFSSGKIQTDFWADILGFPSPIAYELLKSHDCRSTAKKIRGGVNFAVGSSGIFRAYGYTTVPEQVKQFRKLIEANPGFDSHELSRSVVLISAAGNDYLSFMENNNGSTKGLVNLVKPVVSGIVDVVKDLYNSGLRNFVVSGNAPLGCGPQIGKTACDSKYDDVLELHARLLRENVHQLRSNLRGLSIIVPDLVSAFKHIFSNPTEYGFVDMFVACCAANSSVDLCGELNEKGRPLFEVCDKIDKKFFWDMFHPTDRAWYTVMSLYAYGAEVKGQKEKMSFIEGTHNAIEWVRFLGFCAHNITARIGICLAYKCPFSTMKN